MLNALIVAAALGVVPHQQTQPLFPRLFPAPTGQNALEFYVRARDFAKEHNQRSVDVLELESSGKTLLQLQEQYSSRGGDVLALVKKGNQYVCIFPDGDTPWEAFIGAKEIAKVLMQYAQVLFTHGRPNDATDVLLSTMEMADRLAASGANHALSLARTVDAIALYTFHNNHNSLPLASAQQILARTTVPEPKLFIEHCKADADMITRDLADRRRWTMSEIDATNFDDLTEAELTVLRARWAEASNAALAILQDLFLHPEPKWTERKARLDSKSLTTDPNVAVLFTPFGPDSLVETAVTWRTQRRLLRIHALIAQVKWQNGGRLPTSLALLPQEAQLDPTTGVRYAYVVLSSSAYDLYSAGKDYSGDIRLKINMADMPRID